MRQQQTILVIKLQQSFILPFFFDCKKTYSLSLISENQNIIIEAQKRRIKSADQLNRLVNSALKSPEKTILIVIYNNENQKRYIGVKLNQY